MSITSPPDESIQELRRIMLIEEALQLRDHLRVQLIAAKKIGATSVALDVHDARALEQLLTTSLDSIPEVA